ncbi:FAD-binding oxidoreductase [Azospirillum thermophilum]|uniref:FAD-linked oxidase n=1 Tax=Azospirillum thermophilum TaxID=2202148 RepID=A0A2S2CXX0_9PROT|nr:FAD-binding oxidoreductase [Azospirillum thermophilum]AWK89319.1 FAD-linked oxidase [Azospirillum thermophilum]
MLIPLQPSRRTFLVGAGRFAAASALATTLPFPAGAAVDGAARRIESSALKDLAAAVKGGVVLPDDPFFGDYARPNNLRFRTLPAAIARCSSDDDVKACVDWVRKHGVRFAVRSGGHNYAGFSTTPGLLIDMTPMSGISLVPGGDGLVKVSGGAINGAVYQALERLNRSLTHGRCTTVGAAGFLLGGGIGFNMRLYGMGSDLLQATSIVTADGELRRDISDSGADRDLFWACRGGAGGNFGINTSFTLQTFPVETATVFNITWTGKVEEVLHSLLTRLAEAPPEFGSKISVTRPARGSGGPPLTVSLLGQLHKCKVPLEDIIGPVLLDASDKTIHRDMPYWPAQDFLSEFTYPYFYQEKSSYMRAADITPDAVAAMVGLARLMPGTSMPNAFKFFQVGGKVNATAAGATAYVHRGYDWLFSSEVNWWDRKDPKALVDENLAWQERFYAAVNAMAKGTGAFQNFPDPSLTDWSTAYYGSNYARLRQVKTAYDRSGLFTYRQGIKPL